MAEMPAELAEAACLLLKNRAKEVLNNEQY